MGDLVNVSGMMKNDTSAWGIMWVYDIIIFIMCRLLSFSVFGYISGSVYE